MSITLILKLHPGRHSLESVALAQVHSIFVSSHISNFKIILHFFITRIHSFLIELYYLSLMFSTFADTITTLTTLGFVVIASFYCTNMV